MSKTCTECGEISEFNVTPHKKQTCAKCPFSCRCDEQMFKHIESHAK